MAKGVSGYVDFAATKDFVLRVHYEESYDVLSNTTQELQITGIQVSPPHSYGGVWHYLEGTISIGDTVVVSMNPSKPTHRVYLDAANTFYDVSGTLGSATGIVHESDGTKRIPISVYVRGHSDNGASGNGWLADGTQTIVLTTIPVGYIYIDNGSGPEAYQCYIDNGFSWDQYVATVDNGFSFNECG